MITTASILRDVKELQRMSDECDRRIRQALFGPTDWEDFEDNGIRCIPRVSVYVIKDPVLGALSVFSLTTDTVSP